MKKEKEIKAAIEILKEDLLEYRGCSSEMRHNIKTLEWVLGKRDMNERLEKELKSKLKRK